MTWKKARTEHPWISLEKLQLQKSEIQTSSNIDTQSRENKVCTFGIQWDPEMHSWHFRRTQPGARFLVQTQHELALRYNDSAPLENMHSARLFESWRHSWNWDRTETTVMYMESLRKLLSILFSIRVRLNHVWIKSKSRGKHRFVSLSPTPSRQNLQIHKAKSSVEMGSPQEGFVWKNKRITRQTTPAFSKKATPARAPGFCHLSCGTHSSPAFLASRFRMNEFRSF